MNPQQWQKVREIFDATIRRKPEERPKFVVDACGDDRALRAEVESLLNMRKRRAIFELLI